MTCLGENMKIFPNGLIIMGDLSGWKNIKIIQNDLIVMSDLSGLKIRRFFKIVKFSWATCPSEKQLTWREDLARDFLIAWLSLKLLDRRVKTS
jgi:hypothetical protein